MRPEFCRTTRRWSFQRVVAISVIATLSSACVDWVPIKPTELTKLNDLQSVSNAWSGATYEKRQVERVDGSLTEIEGPFDAEVTSIRDESVRFHNPVHAAVAEDKLFIQGGNRARTPFALSDVSTVEVSQKRPARGWMIFLGIAGAVVIASAVATAAIESN